MAWLCAPPQAPPPCRRPARHQRTPPPPWAHRAISKLQKGFLWRGGKEAKGGHWLLAWPKVTHPKELGGLGVHDVRNLGRALRARWPWLQKTEPEKPWAQFQIQTPKEVQNLLELPVVTVVRDGPNTLIWKDRWLGGKRIKELAPAVFALVPKRIANNRKVNEALLNMMWISDVRGALSLAVLLEYFALYQLLQEVVLQPETSDSHLEALCLGTILH
jgi:hypothetical protein